MHSTHAKDLVSRHPSIWLDTNQVHKLAFPDASRRKAGLSAVKMKAYLCSYSLLKVRFETTDPSYPADQAFPTNQQATGTTYIALVASITLWDIFLNYSILYFPRDQRSGVVVNVRNGLVLGVRSFGL
jgi:hypothetical protein